MGGGSLDPLLYHYILWKIKAKSCINEVYGKPIQKTSKNALTPYCINT